VPRKSPACSQPPSASDQVDAWFAQREWVPFAFQRQAWEAYREGKSGLIHAPTGIGKTLAAWLGPVMEAMDSGDKGDGLRVLWITPLRALATDSAEALKEPLEGLNSPWTVDSRTGDTKQSARARLRKKLPSVLVTTPESLSLFLTYDDSRERFAELRCVIVDEWHELLGSKRGVQTELCLARLRAWLPNVRQWGVSATIGNLDEAMRVLLGSESADGVVITGEEPKSVVIETLLPAEMDTFPWSGHLGLRMLPQVVEQIDQAGTTLLFTNTRSQTEMWFQALVDMKPDWEPMLAMHHGSLDKPVRQEVEDRLRDGSVKCVVCTSSLDLGVDFSPVEQVMQVGSPKGIARLLQRAGRSGHRPGAASKVIGVPTNAFELVEFAAAREALNRRQVEARRPLTRTLDVLVQHLVTVALGGGFEALAMRDEITSTAAFADLTDDEWDWALAFVTTGGRALAAYPQYKKVVVEDGRHVVTDTRMARLHRMSIGTITADSAVSVRYANGRKLGTVEEGFIGRIKKNGHFIFAGKRLQLVAFRDLVATVKPATRKGVRGQVPTWNGSKSPLSTELAQAVCDKLASTRDGVAAEAESELQAVAPVLALQQAWSQIPDRTQLLIEETRTRDGNHVYVYPFAGRIVHEGLGTLVAYRFARDDPKSIQVTYNDYGFELHSRSDLFVDDASWRQLLSADHLLGDLLECMNTAELARNQFREVSRVAGLVMQGYPGNSKTARSLQASTSLLYDVFERYDPENLLLAQSQREILERQLEITRMQATMEAMATRSIIKVYCQRLTPMAFPLWADGISSHLSTEDFTTRLDRMLRDLENDALDSGAPHLRPEVNSQ
jgi:ATP-dependent helicase Lhr and Lhr-like helicase